MTDKTVTYADLDDLRFLRVAAETEPDQHPAILLVDRLIAAAEADRPPLPEGWVVYRGEYGGQAVYWHRNGALYEDTNDPGPWDYVEPNRDRLTPLRPTVTEADVERAAQALYVLQRGEWVSGKGITPGGTPWGTSTEAAEHDRFLTLARAAFEAAGIEVRDA